MVTLSGSVGSAQASSHRSARVARPAVRRRATRGWTAARRWSPERRVEWLSLRPPTLGARLPATEGRRALAALSLWGRWRRWVGRRRGAGGSTSATVSPRGLEVSSLLASSGGVDRTPRGICELGDLGGVCSPWRPRWLAGRGAGGSVQVGVELAGGGVTVVGSGLAGDVVVVCVGGERARGGRSSRGWGSVQPARARR